MTRERAQRLLDAHCAERGGVVPANGYEAREWLLALAIRAYQAGQQHPYDRRKALVRMGRRTGRI